MKAIERYEQGLITRGEYLEATGLADTKLDKEIAHLLKLAHNKQFGWIYRYANKIRNLVGDKYSIDYIIDFAMDCRNLYTDPIFRAGDYRDSFEALIEWINGLFPPVPTEET